MKKLLLAAFVMAGIGFSAKAQQGSVLLYGNLGLQTTKTGDAKSTTFNFNPGVGYQLDKHWTVGVELGVGAEKYATPSYQAGAFGRYTWPLNNTFAIYSQLGLGYLHGGEADLNSFTTPAVTANAFYARITGPTVFINVKNNFGVNLGFGSIDFVSGKPKGADKATNSFGINFGNAISVGISKNFGGKK